MSYLRLLYKVPFVYRLLFLLLLMVGYAVFDIIRNKEESIKWKEYSFVIVCGIIGAVFGIINDIITSSISVDYFISFKGLMPGGNLVFRAAILGSKAGCFAGMLSSAIMLHANNPKPNTTQLKYIPLLRLIWRPIACAAACGIVLPVISHFILPANETSKWLPHGTASDVKRFMIVWQVHIGLYLGLVLGTIWALITIRIRKKKS